MNTLTPQSSTVLPGPQGPPQHSRSDPVLIPKHIGSGGVLSHLQDLDQAVPSPEDVFGCGVSRVGISELGMA